VSAESVPPPALDDEAEEPVPESSPRLRGVSAEVPVADEFDPEETADQVQTPPPESGRQEVVPPVEEMPEPVPSPSESVDVEISVSEPPPPIEPEAVAEPEVAAAASAMEEEIEPAFSEPPPPPPRAELGGGSLDLVPESGILAPPGDLALRPAPLPQVPVAAKTREPAVVKLEPEAAVAVKPAPEPAIPVTPAPEPAVAAKPSPAPLVPENIRAPERAAAQVAAFVSEPKPFAPKTFGELIDATARLGE
jgi:hypothetical protein